MICFLSCIDQGCDEQKVISNLVANQTNYYFSIPARKLLTVLV